MRRAVDLDDELTFAANKVGNVSADRLLPHKFPSAELAVSEVSPDNTLGCRRVAALRASAAGFD
jgi:hypothetical protein